jgi:hypothetical protein
MRLYRDTNPYRILQQLAVGGGILLISLANPVAGASMVRSLVRHYFRGKYFERQRFLNDIKHLQNRELVDYKETPDGMVKLTLTQNGRTKILKYKLDEIHIKKPAHWDRKWRLIIFDVPVNKKQARDALGAKLSELGFYPLQKSVYLMPFPCEDEVEFIASVFDVRKHILILNVSNFEGEEKLMHHFGLI